MHRSSSRSLLLALGLALPLSACEAGTGPDDGQTRILLSSGTVESGVSLSLAGVLEHNDVRKKGGGHVSLDLVDSISVTITQVDALRAKGVDDDDDDDDHDDDDDDDESEREWVRMDVTGPSRINLLKLPEGGIALARGDLQAGTYGHLRLHFLDPSITFSEEVTVGRTTYAANERIYLEIPGGRIMLPTTDFTIEEGAGTDINVVFDPAASVRRVTATGSGHVLMNPVLKVGKPARKK